MANATVPYKLYVPLIDMEAALEEINLTDAQYLAVALLINRAYDRACFQERK